MLMHASLECVKYCDGVPLCWKLMQNREQYITDVQLQFNNKDSKRVKLRIQISIRMPFKDVMFNM